jgi:hypothetical protein
VITKFKTKNMIERIKGLAENVAGFRASGTVTKEDYDTVIYPAVKQVADKFKEVNFLMVLDTEIKNFTPGAWLDDALLGLKHLTKWHRVALVADNDAVKRAAAIMDKIVPGEYKGFSKQHEAQAIDWVAGTANAKGETTFNLT